MQKFIWLYIWRRFVQVRLALCWQQVQMWIRIRWIRKVNFARLNLDLQLKTDFSSDMCFYIDIYNNNFVIYYVLFSLTVYSIHTLYTSAKLMCLNTASCTVNNGLNVKLTYLYTCTVNNWLNVKLTYLYTCTHMYLKCCSDSSQFPSTLDTLKCIS